jgi:hypothetical protein
MVKQEEKFKVCIVRCTSSDEYSNMASIIDHTDWYEATKEERTALIHWCNSQYRYNVDGHFMLVDFQPIATYPKKISDILEIQRKEEERLNKQRSEAEKKRLAKAKETAAKKKAKEIEKAKKLLTEEGIKL